MAMLRLLIRLFVQRLKENQSSKLAKKQPRNSKESNSLRKRVILISAGFVVLGGVILVVLNQNRFDAPHHTTNSNIAQLHVQIDSVYSPPLVLFLEPWPPQVSEIKESESVSQILIDQNRFIPTFQLITAGSTIEIVNQDNFLHNAHIINDNDTVFNVATPLKSIRVRKALTATGILKVTCDLHPSMQSWIFVPPNPHYIIVNEPETRLLSNIFPGQYHLKVWEGGIITHERFLTFSPGESKSIKRVKAT